MKKSLPMVKSLKSGETLILHKGLSYHILQKDKSIFKIKLIGVHEYIELGDAKSLDACVQYIDTKDSALLSKVA